MPAPMTAPMPRVIRANGPSSRRSVPEPASASSEASSFLTKSDIGPPIGCEFVYKSQPRIIRTAGRRKAHPFGPQVGVILAGKNRDELRASRKPPGWDDAVLPV